MKKFISTIIILFSVLTIWAQDYSNYTGCSEQDSLALVAFYNATDGPNWTSNQDGFSIDNLGDEVLTYHKTGYPNSGMGKWFEGPVKDWFGVLLEKQPAANGQDSVWRVVHLCPIVNRRSAGDNNLKGYIPRAIGMLTALKWIRINGNVGLGGTEVPDELYQPKLDTLDLEAVYFKGIVSDALRNCTGLHYTNLRYNYFDSIPVMDFYSPEAIAVHQAKTIWIYDNQFSYAILEPSIEFFVENDMMYEARNMTNVGRAKEYVVSPGDNLTLTSDDAGENGTYTWYKNGFSTYLTGSSYTITNITAADTGNYKALTGNEFIRTNDENSDYTNCYTKEIHVTFIPSTPVCEGAIAAENGKSIELEFSKPMAVPSNSQISEFAVSCDGESVAVSGISRIGRLSDRLVLTLDGEIIKDKDVTVEYTKGSVVCTNGGELNSFSVSAVNKAGIKPDLISAETRTDGKGIVLEFDYFIDSDALDASLFKISSTSENSVESVALIDGDIDSDISKKVLVKTSNTLKTSDEITISLSKDAVFSLYGAGINEVNDFEVTNKVIDQTTSVLITVIDGTESIENVFIKGDIAIDTVNLFDDGTNGDEAAEDHTWSVSLDLTDGEFSWDAYQKESKIAYDTTWVDMGNGEVAAQITPYVVYENSKLNEDMVLSFNIDSTGVSGDTCYGYMANSLTLVLDMGSYLTANPETVADPYVMGIEDDWSNGLAMGYTGQNDLYSVTIDGYGYDEEVSYCFRNGDVWENTSAKLRTVTINSDTTITAKFGDYYSTGIQDESELQFKVYPNPVSDYLYFNYQTLSNNVTIQVINIVGIVVRQYSELQESFYLGDLPQGIYLLRVFDENKLVAVKKITKQ